MSKINTINTNTVDIDALLSPSYLLVVQLRQGVPAEQGKALWQHAVQQVEQTRQALREAGYSASSVEHITYAQCALLDETVLGRPEDEGYFAWLDTPLQAHFFNTLQAGELLYERMRNVLQEPAADPAVLTCFHRVLLLGFQGRYRHQSQEPREQLIASLTERVTPFTLPQGTPLLVNARRHRPHSRLLQSRLFWSLLSVVLLAGMWWGLNQSLTQLLNRLLPGSQG